MGSSPSTEAATTAETTTTTTTTQVQENTVSVGPDETNSLEHDEVDGSHPKNDADKSQVEDRLGPMDDPTDANGDCALTLLNQSEEEEQQQDGDNEGQQQQQDDEDQSNKASDVKLIVIFLLLVVTGSANTVFYKLQAIPLYNYPNFLNIFSNAAYVGLTFSYIIPVARYGWFGNAISTEQMALPKRPFAVIGLLDCLATSLQIFAAVYLPGPLLVLLPQAAIPISMILSKHILGDRYRWFQYFGALTVIVGILVVLEPVLSHRHAAMAVCEAIDMDADCTICQVETTMFGCLSHVVDDTNSTEATAALESPWNDRMDHSSLPLSLTTDYSAASSALSSTTTTTTTTTHLCQWVPIENHDTSSDSRLVLLWSCILIFSCVPMALSSIYKEIAVGGDVEIDPVYINGWVAFFQTLYSFVLAIPAGLVTSPVVYPPDLASNVYDGLRCYFGMASIHGGCHPDTLCHEAAAYLNWGLVANVAYTVTTMMLIQHGSANLYFLALTVMVPLGNLTFALPFMPGKATFHLSDVLGLCVIVAGLVVYRFAGTTSEKRNEGTREVGDEQDSGDDDDDVQRRGMRNVGETGAVGLDSNNSNGLSEPLLPRQQQQETQ